MLGEGLKDWREGCDVRLRAETGSEGKVKLCADRKDGCVRKGGCNYRLWKKEVGGGRKAAANGSLVRSNASKAKVLVILPPVPLSRIRTFSVGGTELRPECRMGGTRRYGGPPGPNKLREEHA